MTGEIDWQKTAAPSKQAPNAKRKARIEMYFCIDRMKNVSGTSESMSSGLYRGNPIYPVILCVLSVKAFDRPSPKLKTRRLPSPALIALLNFQRRAVIPLKRQRPRSRLHRLQLRNILRHRRAQLREPARRNQHPILQRPYRLIIRFDRPVQTDAHSGNVSGQFPQSLM